MALRGTRYFPFYCSKCEGVKVLSHEELCECGGILQRTRQLKRVEGVIPDDIPGGFVMPHLCIGKKVYSRTELNQALAEYNKANDTTYRVSDYGWTGPNDQVFTKQGGTYADFRTKEDRVREMAAFLGVSVEEYHSRFDTDAQTVP